MIIWLNDCFFFKEFEKQTEKMDLKEEMMNDTLDGVMEEDGDQLGAHMCPARI